MTEPLIRTTRPGDGPALARLWRDLGGFFAEGWPATGRVPALEGLAEWFETIGAELRNAPDKVYLVADDAGEIVGTVLATLHEPAASAPRQVSADLGRRRLFVDSLGVAYGLRRGGVGTLLLDAALDWGRSRGAEVALLETQYDNPLSIPFYQRRMGFTDHEVVLRKDLTRGVPG